MLQPTLSILLPAHNAQQHLGQMVAHLLEALPELTKAFDLVIIDDASSDATSEVAHELSLCYPQVQFIRNAKRGGPNQAMRIGLRQTSGELMLLCAEDCRLDVRDLHKLWQRMGGDNVVFASSASRRAAQHMLSRPTTPLDALQFDLMIVRRSVVAGWLASGSRQDLLAYLFHKGFPLHEVEMRDRAEMAPPADPSMAGSMPKAARAAVKAAPRRPNYLDRLKALALGE